MFLIQNLTIDVDRHLLDSDCSQSYFSVHRYETVKLDATSIIITEIQEILKLNPNKSYFCS